MYYAADYHPGPVEPPRADRASLLVAVHNLIEFLVAFHNLIEFCESTLIKPEYCF